MSVIQSYRKFLALAVLGIVTVASTSVLLGLTAGVFFGFAYIVLMPLLYELVAKLGPKPVRA